MNVPSWIIAIVGFLSLMNTIFVGWAIWSIKRIAKDKAEEVTKPVSDRIQQVETKLAQIGSSVQAVAPAVGEISQIEQRLTRIEGAIEHLPTADEITDLLVQVTEMNGRLLVQGEQTKGVLELFTRLERKVDLIDGYLRQGGSK